jgi:hypothetical protein
MCTPNATRALPDLLDAIGATIDWAPASSNPYWGSPSADQFHHYEVSLAIDGESMTFPYSMGRGHPYGAVDATDVVACLALDYLMAGSCRSFENFCDEFGYDEDSRRAECMYRSTKDMAQEFRRVCGDHLPAILEAAQDW